MPTDGVMLAVQQTSTLLEVLEGVIDTDIPGKRTKVLVELDEKLPVSVFTGWTTCNTFPADSPVTVAPVTSSVAPDGKVNGSPESPSVNAVPVAGLTLFVFSSLLMV